MQSPVIVMVLLVFVALMFVKAIGQLAIALVAGMQYLLSRRDAERINKFAAEMSIALQEVEYA